MNEIKKFGDFKINENSNTDTDFMRDRINNKISSTKKDIERKEILINTLEEKINNEYELIYDSYHNNKENIEFDIFLRKYKLGKVLTNFYDPYDSLMESHIKIYKNFILWERNKHRILYIS